MYDALFVDKSGGNGIAKKKKVQTKRERCLPVKRKKLCRSKDFFVIFVDIS